MSGKYKLLSLVILILVAVLVLSLTDQRDVAFFAKAAILFLVALPVSIVALEKKYGLDKTRTIIANTVLLFLSIVVTLVAAEVVVRYSFGDVTTTADNSSYFARRWRQEAPLSVNKAGFREREYSLDKKGDTFQIAVIGDSFTYGQGIAEDARFTNIIERRLNESASNYKVLNFGRPGAETVDHLQILEEYVLDISPDFIILQWFTNDVEGHDKSGRPKPMRLIPSSYLLNYFHKNSALFYLINSGWKSMQTRFGLAETYDSYMAKRFGDPDNQSSRAASSALEAFLRRAREEEIPVGIVMFPNLVEVAGMAENYPYGFLFDRVLEACHRHDIKCLDMRPLFAGVSPASKLWVNRFDTHPGPIANEITAAAVLRMFDGEWRN